MLFTVHTTRLNVNVIKAISPFRYSQASIVVEIFANSDYVPKA